jgi:hypothetical protein
MVEKGPSFPTRIHPLTIGSTASKCMKLRSSTAATNLYAHLQHKIASMYQANGRQSHQNSDSITFNPKKPSFSKLNEVIANERVIWTLSSHSKHQFISYWLVW